MAASARSSAAFMIRQSAGLHDELRRAARGCRGRHGGGDPVRAARVFSYVSFDQSLPQGIQRVIDLWQIDADGTNLSESGADW